MLLNSFVPDLFEELLGLSGVVWSVVPPYLLVLEPQGPFRNGVDILKNHVTLGSHTGRLCSSHYETS